MCPTKPRELGGHSACVDAGGRCVLARDGFYTVAWACMAIGTIFGLAYARHLPALMRLPLQHWRASSGAEVGAGPAEAKARQTRDRKQRRE
mmetsp:Transcript_14596/g.25469  ORF Transcript_14596/g.25469 Transcript_14596/m.25469 type:complete len:91 (+) Transcript_14596:1-273(+)